MRKPSKLGFLRVKGILKITVYTRLSRVLDHYGRAR